ncbi:MAG: hypothetical protein M0Z53_10710 [Thermaerobacter sp.]|nr:hypothetical protein [Thermaerobacter sp.]
MMAMMWAGTLIWLAILVVLAVATATWFRHLSHWRRDADDPLAILQLRLARGEISLNEYEALRQHLER